MSIQLAQGLRACRFLSFWGLLASVVQAHIGLDSPNGGETLDGGSVFTIEWHVEVEHNQRDWDLWVSTESNEGPWQEIAVDLATGDSSKDSIHTFDWSVPNSEITSAWVRVQQDNAGKDYDDVSDASFQIQMSALGGGDFTGDGRVDTTDLAVWELGFGRFSTAVPANGDADLDLDVDGADFLAWQSDYNRVGRNSAGVAVPEPAASLLLLLGMIILLLRK